MKVDSLRELFVDQLLDLYDAERQISEALPKMSEAAGSNQLKQAFNDHLEQTKVQHQRLEQIFDTIGVDRSSKVKCKGMKGIIDEGEEMLKKAKDADVRDASLIASAQRVEHYEIAGYGTARSYAQLLGENEAASMLQQTLDEENLTDRKLTRIAESSVNVEARKGS